MSHICPKTNKLCSSVDINLTKKKYPTVPSIIYLQALKRTQKVELGLIGLYPHIAVSFL